jgi:aminomethyltransferase
LSSVEATPAGAATTVRKTALNAVHRQMGAKMVDFNGWEMPVEYPAAIGCGIINEHMAVRTGVGIFDVSHMGDIRLAGPQALAAVQHISMNDASRLAVGQAQYSALLYPQGTFVDDVIVHRLGEDEYLLVINAGTREKDFNWVRDNTRQFDCAVENLSDDFTQIAIQGPKGVDVLQKLTDADLSAVKYFAPRRQPVPLRTRDFRYDQCVGSRARPLLQDGKAGVRRPHRTRGSEGSGCDADFGGPGDDRARHRA